MMTTKKFLRKNFKALRKNLPPSALVYDSWALTATLLETINWKKYNTLHTYLPMQARHELNTFPLIYALWRAQPHLRICVPRVNMETQTLENLLLTAETRLAVQSFGQFEPVNPIYVPHEEVDIVLVPLLAYDLRGYRVGYGKGHYDKFLPTCHPNAFKFGISQFAPVPLIADIDEFDVSLDKIFY